MTAHAIRHRSEPRRHVIAAISKCGVGEPPRRKEESRIYGGKIRQSVSSATCHDVRKGIVACETISVLYQVRRAGVSTGLRGMENENVEPGPSFLAAQIRPLCLSTMARLTDNPIPMPSLLVV